MAWHYITYRCGHEGREQIYGPTKNRDWIAERKAEKLCPECYQKQLEEKRAEENRKAAEAAKEQGLPELIGTKNQVPWAKTIRQQFIEGFNEFVESERFKERYQKRLETEDIKTIDIFQFVLSKTSASWWIDNRSDDFCSSMYYLLRAEIGNIEKIKEKEIKPRLDKSIIEEAKIEATVRPENIVTETIAEINIIDNSLKIVFREKRDDFRELVKQELNMKWEGSYWKRQLTNKNGAPEDRAAEAGHKLLAAGFLVRIFDEVIREKAITGDYKLECTCWIQKRIEGKYDGWFAISWGRNEDYYKPARAIPGSRWSSPSVVIPPEQFEAVQDFAKMYNFKLSEGALEVIQLASEAKRKTLLVDVKPPEKKEKIVHDAKPPILEVPGEVEIDESLRDDD